MSRYSWRIDEAGASAAKRDVRVVGVAAAAHADLDVMSFEQICVALTSVLHAAVRMMDQTRGNGALVGRACEPGQMCRIQSGWKYPSQRWE
jgi:hypothetical protein